MTPTVRSQTRSLTLSAALDHSALKGAWKNTVRHGLRRQPIGDLHDHMDIHRRLPLVIGRLHNEVVSGTYRTREPEYVRLEKNLGVSRRVVLPSAEDAIVLQALIDRLERRILNQAPTRRGYYSRSHAPPSIYEVDHTFPYPWWELWPEFQERIWQFAEHHDFVVMTDIATYFDAISLQMLRNRLAALARVNEETVDFLFYLLDGFVWRPDYIPHTGVGLPQIQFDAPRLLAHLYLFEADRFLERRTSGSFVRWMDDINIGVESQGEGKEILRDLDEMVATMGLHLNASKTRILSGADALEHLWMNENRRLNVLGNILAGGNLAQLVGPFAKKRFRTFWRSERHGAWGKVLRRYISLFTNLKDSILDPLLPEMLHDLPGVRDKVFNYCKVLGYSPKRFGHVSAFVRSPDCTDDVGYCGAMDLVVSWDIPKRSPNRGRAVELAESTWRKEPESQAAFGAALAVVAKFSSSRRIRQFIDRAARVWRRSEWSGRQVAAVTPILEDLDRRRVLELLQQFRLREATDILLHLRELSRLQRLDPQMRLYLIQSRGRYPYSFPKVLISLALLKGSLQDPDRLAVLNQLKSVVQDSRYHELAARF